MGSAVRTRENRFGFVGDIFDSVNLSRDSRCGFVEGVINVTMNNVLNLREACGASMRLYDLFVLHIRWRKIVTHVVECDVTTSEKAACVGNRVCCAGQ